MSMINPHDGPVIKELESEEIVFAKDQPQYKPLRALAGGNTVLTRWSPTPEQRQAIMDGEDLFLELMTFKKPLQPIRLSVGMSLEDAVKILK